MATRDDVTLLARTLPYQPPSLLADAAVLANRRIGESASARNQHLEPDHETLAGDPNDLAYWVWTVDAHAPAGHRIDVAALMVPRRGSEQLDFATVLAETPLIGQPTTRPEDSLNSRPRVWRRSLRGWTQPPPSAYPPEVQWFPVEELVGHIDSVEEGQAACSMVRRGLDHDVYDIFIEVDQFPGPPSRVVPGSLFYWTFGELATSAGRYDVSKIRFPPEIVTLAATDFDAARRRAGDEIAQFPRQRP